MKVYTNENHEIIGVDKATENYSYEYELGDNELGNWCETALKGFCYTPSYELELNRDGTIKLDETGKDVYRLDADGNKIQSGFAFYPFIDFNIIRNIQELHEKEEAKYIETDEYNIDLDYRLSCLELGI